MSLLLVDTREQKWEHVRDGLSRLGVSYDRSKLYVGDYAWADKQNVSVDRKQNLEEVYGNLIQSHKRFRNECQRAKDAGVRLIILVEQTGINSLDDVAGWKNPREERWNMVHAAQQRGKLMYTSIPTKPPVPSSTLAAIMRSMEDKYGIQWRFCDRHATAVTIIDLLGG